MHMMHTYADKTFIHIKIKTYSLSVSCFKNREAAQLEGDCEAAAMLVYFIFLAIVLAVKPAPCEAHTFPLNYIPALGF